MQFGMMETNHPTLSVLQPTYTVRMESCVILGDAHESVKDNVDSIEKMDLPVEKTTSGGCGFFLAAFSRLASACPSDRVSQGVFSIF